MSTSFEDIYCLNTTIMNDSRLKNLTTDRYYQILSYYLSFATAQFIDWCNEDLTDVTSYSRNEYLFEGDGITTDYVLSPAPQTDANFYVGIAGAETTNYTYTEGTFTLSFDMAPPKGNDIYVVTYVVGSFEADLNLKEKTILAEGMVIPLIEYQKNRTKALDQIAYTKDFNSFSQANHNKVVLDTKNEAHLYFLTLLNDYTYSSFVDNDNLENLGGDSTRTFDS